jgi:ribosomal protein S18 acetylase RimI-like enzyme
MSKSDVVEAKADDIPWITLLYYANEKILGNPFWLLNSYNRPNHALLVVRPVGFVHYKRNTGGMKTIIEMAVSQSAKRSGIGKQLVKAVGRPVSLKTDADNVESNAFYRAMGLMCVGQTRSRSGKTLNVYQGW